MSSDKPEDQTPRYTVAPPGTKHDYGQSRGFTLLGHLFPTRVDGSIIQGEQVAVSPDSTLNNIAQLLAVQKEKDAAELERMKTDLPYFMEKVEADLIARMEKILPEGVASIPPGPDQMTILRRLADAKPGTMRFGRDYRLTVELPREHYRVTSNYSVELLVPLAGTIQIKYTTGHFKPVPGKLDAIVGDIRKRNGFITQRQINDALRGFYVHSRKGKRKRSHALRKRTWYASTNMRVFETIVLRG